MTSFFTLAIVQSALEVGFIYALVAMALFLSYSVLNIADLSTDNCFILGCAVGSTVALAGHPFLGLFAAMAAVILLLAGIVAFYFKTNGVMIVNTKTTITDFTGSDLTCEEITELMLSRAQEEGQKNG